MKLLAALLLSIGLAAVAGPRSAAERLAFIRENPCPSTNLRRGSCPGWEVDHAIPLCAGGPDHRSNLQWLRVEDHRFKTRIDVRECRRQRSTSQ